MSILSRFHIMAPGIDFKQSIVDSFNRLKVAHEYMLRVLSPYGSIWSGSITKRWTKSEYLMGVRPGLNVKMDWVVDLSNLRNDLDGTPWITRKVLGSSASKEVMTDSEELECKKIIFYELSSQNGSLKSVQEDAVSLFRNFVVILFIFVCGFYAFWDETKYLITVALILSWVIMLREVNRKIVVRFRTIEQQLVRRLKDLERWQENNVDFFDRVKVREEAESLAAGVGIEMVKRKQSAL